MKFKCEICNLLISNQIFLDEHLAGPKHKQQVEKKASLEELASRSVYLNNFKHPIEVNELKQEMEQYGEVDRIIPDNSGKNAFAIVEFVEKDPAQNILHSIQRLKIDKSIVRIKPRHLDFDKIYLFKIPEKQNQIESVHVLDCINQSKSGIVNQLDALIGKFAISNDIVNERDQFAQELQQFIQRYFISAVHVRIFGSTLNGLGFYNSDLDLNMVFEEDLKYAEDNDDTNIDSHNIGSSMDLEIQLTAEFLLQNPLSRETYVKLSKMDRVRLLNQLINAFRKEKALITAHVPVPDARTPVVRLLMRNFNRTPCELSVQNLLGECKANLVRDIIRAETTGTLWRLLFLLKLWASANGLFSLESPHSLKQKINNQRNKTKSNSSNSDVFMDAEASKHSETEMPLKHQQQTHSKSAWNSYILSLCTIAFLQNKQRMPSIEQLMRPNAQTINGWAIEYDLPFFKLDEDISNLLKDLFTFMYQQLKEDRVIMPRLGCIINVKQFKQNYANKTCSDCRIVKSWRFSSVVNLQDPLELSHNVAANVSKESLAKLRWKIMYSISVIKKSPNNFLERLFHLDNLRQLHEERRAEKSQNREIANKRQLNASSSNYLAKHEIMDVDS